MKTKSLLTETSLCNVQEIIQNFERKKAIFVFFSNTGVEETLYLLLLVAKKNRKSVDIQNSKGKVKTEEKAIFPNKIINLFLTPFFYARTPRMTLLLSLLSDPSIIDRKNHSVLESCIKFVVFPPRLVSMQSQAQSLLC